MNKLKLVLYILPFSLSITACTSVINLDNKLVENEKITSEKQDSVINISEESKNISDRDKIQQDVVIENLPNGNYGFCKQPVSSKATSDLKGWCFMFGKSNNHIVGLYTLWLPSDYARICIDGKIKGNTITGIGSEIIESDSKTAVTPEDVALLAKEGVWDNLKVEGGNNLRVSTPSLYSIGKYSSGQHYGWIVYQSVQLNLNGFDRRNLGKFIPPEICPS